MGNGCVAPGCLALPRPAATAAASAYQNLQVAVYARAQEVVRMSDPAWLEGEWQRIASAVHVDKVYLEVHRDGIMPDDEDPRSRQGLLRRARREDRRRHHLHHQRTQPLRDLLVQQRPSIASARR